MQRHGLVNVGNLVLHRRAVRQTLAIDPLKLHYITLIEWKEQKLSARHKDQFLAHALLFLMSNVL